MSVYLSIVKISLGGAAVVKAQLPVDQAQRYGASNLRVFGSVALNQEHQDSDLDLLVDLPANQSLLALVGIAQELERLLGALSASPSTQNPGKVSISTGCGEPLRPTCYPRTCPARSR